MAEQIQLRRDDAATWTSVDPTLAEGEIGIELVTGKGKIGNGVDSWTALPYALFPPTGVTTLRAAGAVGSHTGNTTRTSIDVLTIPGGTLGANGSLEIWIGARMDAAPTGTWLLELEFDGDVIAQWQTADASPPINGMFVQNQNDDAIQVGAFVGGLAAGDFTIDTSVDVDLEVFVTINDAGDTGKTISVYSLLVRAMR